MKKTLIISIAIFFLINLAIVSASIGIGVSPSKVYDKMQSKQEKNFTFSIYNTGDITLKAKMSASEEMNNMVTFYPEEITIEPEPEPHRLPAVNGKNVIVTLKAPVTNKIRKITGHIVATAGSGGGSTFGGSGAVASRFELEISPPTHFWEYWTRTQVTIGSIIIALVLGLLTAILIMKKKGLSVGLIKK